MLITAQGAAYDPGTPTEHDDHVIPPLRLVLGANLGMAVHVVAASRTLADRIPALGAETAEREFGRRRGRGASSGNAALTASAPRPTLLNLSL